MRPALILAAAVLFILDWVIMIILQGGGLLVPLRRGLNTILIALLISGATPCMARENASPATDLFLGYITTESMNDISRAGLESLAEALNARTSAEVAGISALSPGDNNISLYPFLYWPITAQASALTAEERQNIQDYLNHGGMIIFDTLGTGSPSQAALQNLTEGLTIPTLQEMPADHVLSKSFYLLDPVQMYGSIWLASADTQGKDIVSPIIVINSNLARHWAASRPGISNKAQDMDIRFGINLAMYALTGNYKADQVHLPAIVERLGR